MASGIKINVNLAGFKEFREKLEYAPEVLRHVSKKMLDRGTGIIEAKAKQKVPIDNGYLKGSITRKVSLTTGRVGTNIKYAPYMEYGTGIYSEYPGAPKTPIRPKRGKYIVFRPKSSKGRYVTSRTGRRYYRKGSGDVVFARQVKGAKPHFFMRAGYQELERRIGEILDYGHEIVSKLAF